MVKRKNLKLLFLVPVIFALAGCSLFTPPPADQFWNNLNPDQKARIIIDGLQTKLGILFDNGKTYIVVHPQYQQDWQKKIVPAFDLANKAIKDQITLGKAGALNPDNVYLSLQPLVNQVVLYLVQIGAVSSVQKAEVSEWIQRLLS